MPIYEFKQDRIERLGLGAGFVFRHCDEIMHRAIQQAGVGGRPLSLNSYLLVTRTACSRVTENRQKRWNGGQTHAAGLCTNLDRC